MSGTKNADIVVLVPRFGDIRNVVNVLRKYMGSSVHIVSDIFRYLYSGYDLDGRKCVFLIEWGTSEKLARELFHRIGKTTPIYTLIRSSPTSFEFDEVRVEVSPIMREWYLDISKPKSEIKSNHVKHMASNYYFSGTDNPQLLDALSQPHVYGQRFDKLPSHDPDMWSKDLYEGILTHNKLTVSLDEIGLNHLSSFYPNVRNPQYNNWSKPVGIREESPKLYHLISKFIHTPGKWVVLTSFNNLYGIKLIQYIFGLIFGGVPLALDPSVDCDRESEIIERFNQTPYNVLVSSVVPSEDLVDVTNVFVLELSDLDFIYMTLKRIKNPNQRIKVGILTLVDPPEYKKSNPNGQTHSEIRTRQAFDKIFQNEQRYQQYVKVAKDLVLTDSSIPERSYDASSSK